jgi:ATP-dependent RNA helicase DeaD
MTDFTTMSIPSALVDNLLKMQFTTPTPIQEKAIPLAIAGRDLMGSAQTGTGKTGAFLIPLLTRLMSSDTDETALVIAPTRELAHQVHQQAHAMMGRSVYLATALLIGGDSYHKQNRQLEKSPRIVVGTPGRINDHIDQGRLRLNRCTYLVLDETDRMLDMGFSVQIDQILKSLPSVRQTLLFSATFPGKIQQIAKKYLNNPEMVLVGRDSAPSQHIEQENRKLNESDKFDELVTELGVRTGTVIVFVKSKFQTERMAKQLSRAGITSDAIHGDLRQGRRNRVIESYRRGKYRVLVATDVAARGLDIPHIEHVINYDLPQSPEDYIHRIGRTARAGAKGAALNFIAPVDRRKWAAIDELMNPGSNPSMKSSRASRSSRPAPSRSGAKSHRSRSSEDGRFDHSSRSSQRRHHQDDSSYRREQKSARPYAKQPGNFSGDRPYANKSASRRPAMNAASHQDERSYRDGAQRQSFGRGAKSSAYSGQSTQGKFRGKSNGRDEHSSHRSSGRRDAQERHGDHPGFSRRDVQGRRGDHGQSRSNFSDAPGDRPFRNRGNASRTDQQSKPFARSTSNSSRPQRAGSDDHRSKHHPFDRPRSARRDASPRPPRVAHKIPAKAVTRID